MPQQGLEENHQKFTTLWKLFSCIPAGIYFSFLKYDKDSNCGFWAASVTMDIIGKLPKFSGIWLKGAINFTVE